MAYASRKLQLLKHITGGSYQSIMIISAALAGTWAAGTTPLWYVIVTGAVSILLSRISSQLDYWQNKSIIREELDRQDLKTKRLESVIGNIKDNLRRDGIDIDKYINIKIEGDM